MGQIFFTILARPAFVYYILFIGPFNGPGGGGWPGWWKCCKTFCQIKSNASHCLDFQHVYACTILCNAELLHMLRFLLFPKGYADFCYKLSGLFLLQITDWMPQVRNVLVLILTANVAGVHMFEISFKMLQNEGKLIIFIRGQQKTIPSYPPQNCHLPVFTVPHAIFILF